MGKEVNFGKLWRQTNLNTLTEDPDDYMLSLLGSVIYSLNDLTQLVGKGCTAPLGKGQLITSFSLIEE